MSTSWNGPTVPTYKGGHRGRLTFSTRPLGWPSGHYVGRHHAIFCDFCDFCDGPVLTSVRDEVAVSWIGDGASTYCSRACLERHAEHRINAAGGTS